MELGGLVDFAIILYGAVVLFSLITLPVEFDASRRAVVTLDEYGILSTEENAAAKKVLRAAAMTYVASMLVALGSFLRILTLFEEDGTKRWSRKRQAARVCALKIL